MTKKLTVLQDGEKECGSACLLSIIKYYGGNISLDKLNELTNTNKYGTNFYQLEKASNEIGLSAKGYKVEDIDKLFMLDKPFISQVAINNYLHFVVVYKMKSNKITIMDPAKGMINLNIKDFNKIWTSYILILEPYKKLPIYIDNNYLNKIIKEVLINNKTIIINLLLLTLIFTILTCINSYHFKIIIDNIITTNKLNLIVITVIFIIIFEIKEITEYLRNNLLLYLNQKIDLSIITTTIDKIISLPYSYYKNKTTGDIISRINDLMYIKNVISEIITTIFFDMILAFVILLFLFSINKVMTLLLFIIIIIYFLVLFLFKNNIKYLTNNLQEENANINSLLIESITSYDTIKGLNLEKKFKIKINKQYLKFINSNLNLNKLILSSEFLKNLFEGIVIIFIIYIGTIHVMDKSLSIGSLVTYHTLLYFSIVPIKNILSFYKELYYVKNSIKRINNLLNYKYEKLDKTNNLNMGGNIYINNLSFSYNSKTKVLDNLNLEIPPKTKLLLLGPSGSGKSTLLKLLFKYYEVERNKIFISNYDINDFELLDIRKNITYISQNDFIYTDTIRNNIIMERNILEEEFIKVCKITYIDDIIKDNILGYNFRLEENGTNISGGQRQRIILARALLKESKILLIDEGLNEIDINLERKILKNIFSYYSNKIIITVSHRLDNKDLYDKVITIKEGKIK